MTEEYNLLASGYNDVLWCLAVTVFFFAAWYVLRTEI
jgi:hypothetical protein